MSTTTEQETLHEILAKLERLQELVQQPQPSTDTLVQIELLLSESITSIRKALGIKKWPEPTVEPPDMATLQEWFFDSMCEETDGCVVEHDGTCPHSHPSWFLRLGLI